MKTKTNDISKCMPSTDKSTQVANTLPESPSTLSGPSGLLIGERSFSHRIEPAHQSRNELILKLGNNQESRFVEKINYSDRSLVADKTSTLWSQHHQLSVIHNESDDFPFISERRIVINDRPCDEKS